MPQTAACSSSHSALLSQRSRRGDKCPISDFSSSFTSTKAQTAVLNVYLVDEFEKLHRRSVDDGFECARRRTSPICGSVACASTCEIRQPARQKDNHNTTLTLSVLYGPPIAIYHINARRQRPWYTDETAVQNQSRYTPACNSSRSMARLR